MLQIRYERVMFPVAEKFRLIHISDVHFSYKTTHAENLAVTRHILHQVQRCTRRKPVRVICVTGDLISRKYTRESFSDAFALLQKLRRIAPVLYSMGNHEMDWYESHRTAFLRQIAHAGITVLDNRTVRLGSIGFTGLTLPQTVYRHPNGSYRRLSAISREMVESCVGKCRLHPHILLAHTPLGFPAYAQWGADAVLSGHVHGGIIRICGRGMLSPERRFLPKYTKGCFYENGCMMNVSAGIGKFRINNPAEIVCLDLCPESSQEGTA